MYQALDPQDSLISEQLYKVLISNCRLQIRSWDLVTASHGPGAHNSLAAKLVLLKECQGSLTSKVTAVHHASLNRLGLQVLIDRTLIKTDVQMKTWQGVNKYSPSKKLWRKLKLDLTDYTVQQKEVFRATATMRLHDLNTLCFIEAICQTKKTVLNLDLPQKYPKFLFFLVTEYFWSPKNVSQSLSAFSITLFRRIKKYLGKTDRQVTPTVLIRDCYGDHLTNRRGGK